MLELKSIIKNYPAGSGIVEALRGIDLKFRNSEFVSILGPSGCGKTTMLNIIGGLDQYTSGDLIINGKSTKDFSDRDWDGYRNHSIGFVFQSYNLIPHQSVLQNVEIALSLSGVSKSERKKRAVEALKKVGLGDQMNKKPGEMSGGQMQRVAIARAIVNDPDIILADEPTGALDTETSEQVMNILKEIAKDRLIIMVTHNPDLAERYSTRIIRMLDGKITNDSMPPTAEEMENCATNEIVSKKAQKTKKSSMSFATSFGLSLKNLITKKGRTMLTSFAGSIGIIGIALIYAVSQGTTAYIDAVQEETLSSYPLTLEATHMDISSLLTTFMGKVESNGEHELDAVYQTSMIYDMINALNSSSSEKNDLKAFKEYIEKERAGASDSQLNKAINGVQYTYDLDMLVYAKNEEGKIVRSDIKELMQEIILEHFGMDMTGITDMSESGGLMSSMTAMSKMSPASSSAVLWQEMLSGDGETINPMLKKQYDLIYGDWPTAYNEVVIVVNKKNELDDMTLYALGLKSKESIDEVTRAALNGEEIRSSQNKWSYEDICNMEFMTILNSDCYIKDEKTGLYTDLRETEAGLMYLYNNGIPLRVSGIIRPDQEAASAMLSGSIAYTGKLTEYIVEQSKKSEAIKEQQKSTQTDILTGLPFKENTGNLSALQKKDAFKSYVDLLDEKGKADMFVKISGIPSKEQTDEFVNNMLNGMTRADMEEKLIAPISAQMDVSEEESKEYVSKMSDDDIKSLFVTALTEQFKSQYAMQAQAQLAPLQQAQLAATLEATMSTYTDEQFVEYYDNALEFSQSSLEKNLTMLGCVDLDSPSTVNLYASSFENKDVIKDAIKEYNKNVGDLEQITYTDYVGLIMSSVTTIIDAITYVLIAFVAVSLIVSSIMIGVITLISVQERTKEIGILRAIGASKRNISSMFNAETMIIGLSSGLVGVLFTYIVCIPLNAILKSLTGISNLRAFLPLETAVFLVLLSMLLTLVSGIIPARSAAKKDPVAALRSE